MSDRRTLPGLLASELVRVVALRENVRELARRNCDGPNLATEQVLHGLSHAISGTVAAFNDGDPVAMLQTLSLLRSIS